MPATHVHRPSNVRKEESMEILGIVDADKTKTLQEGVFFRFAEQKTVKLFFEKRFFL